MIWHTKMSSTLNWGASLGSQFLAELSLIEAEVKKQNPSNGEAPVVQSCDIISETQTLVKGSTNSDCEKRKSGNAESLGENMLVPSLSSTFSLVESSGPSQGSRKQTVSSHSPLLCSTPIGAVSIRKASLRSSTLSQLQLQNWGLPPAVVEKYREKKITNLFPWQVDCLRTGLVLKGGNLVYSAPTSSGKTLVSELLMLKTVIEKKKKGTERIDGLINRSVVWHCVQNQRLAKSSVCREPFRRSARVYKKKYLVVSPNNQPRFRFL